MDAVEFAKLLGQGGITVAALFMLGRIVARVGERMIRAMDGMRDTLDEHTKTDTAALSSLRQEVTSSVAGLRQDIAVLRAVVEEWRGERQAIPELSPDGRSDREERSDRSRYSNGLRSGVPVVDPRTVANRRVP